MKSDISIIKIFTNSLWYGIIPKLSTLLNIILLPLITPFLTASDYGLWGIISAYSGMALVFCSLGLNVHLSNSYYEYKSSFRLVWRRISFLIHFFSLITACLFVIILLFSLSDIVFSKRLIISLLASFPILLSTNAILATHLYPLRSTPKPLVLRNLTSSIIGVLTTFVFIYFFRTGYVGFVIGASVASILNYILFIKPLWVEEKIVPQYDRNFKRISAWLKISIPVIPHSLGFILLASSSRIIMSFYNVSMTEIGIYTNGTLFGDYINVFILALIVSLSPKMQERYRDQDFKQFRFLYALCQTVALSAVFLFSLWMPEVYKILIKNQELQQAAGIAQYTCFAYASLPIYCFMSTIVFINKDTKKLLWLVFVPSVITVILNSIFIPIYGYRTAMYVTLISFWSQFLIPLLIPYYKEKTKQWMPHLYYIFLLLLGTAALLILATNLSSYNFFIKLAVSLLFSTIVLYLIYRINLKLK